MSVQSEKCVANILGMLAVSSAVYRGRLEVHLYGKRGVEIRDWIRDTFGDEDDLVYTNSSIDSSVEPGCNALITEQQLGILLLRWS